MKCPECGSDSVSKDKQMGGWTGDYICGRCGYSDAPSAFSNNNPPPIKKKPLPKIN